MILYGASGHGKVIIDILESVNTPDIVIWDDAEKPSIMGYEVRRPLPSGAPAGDSLVIGIGVNAVRKKIAEQLAGTVTFGNAIHAAACISGHATVGEGTVVMAGATLNPDVRVGRHCIINTNASIDHDCVIGDYAHISPNATLSGNVEVGEGTHIGSGAVAIQGVKIGKWCTIGAGAVIIGDLPDFVTAVGNPAKVIKVNHQ